MPPAAPPTGTSDQALGALQAFQSGERSGGDILGIKQQQMGVPGAQQQVSGLRQAITNTTNLLNQVAPSVYGRTQNSLVTDAQANRQIGNEQAPLNTQLNKESQDYTGASADLATLNSRADQAAQLDLQSQSNQEAGLKSIYDALYGREQDSAKMAEAKRQFDASLSARGSGGSGGSAGASTPSGASGGGSFSIPLRVPGNPGAGFNFGNSNALAYSQAQQIPFRTLLQQMANAGDSGAKAGLQFIGNDGNADPSKVTSPALANLYYSLTGRKVGVRGSSKQSSGFPTGAVQIPTKGGIPGL